MPICKTIYWFYLRFKMSQNDEIIVCQKCGTSVKEIMETGFVGCEKCYDIPAVKEAVNKMFGGKRNPQKND